MNDLDTIKNLDRAANSNFLIILAVGVIAFLTKAFEIIQPSLVDFSLLPLIDLIIITSGIIGAKYFFALRSKLDNFLSSKSDCVLYSKYSLYIIILIDVVYIINLLVFLLTMNLLYIFIAVLLLVLYLIYKPRTEPLSSKESR